MDLNLSQADLPFREEVRTFLNENLFDDLREAARLTPAVRTPVGPARRWAKILSDKGWLCHPWPAEYGGPGWNVVQKYIYELECAMASYDAVELVSII